MAIIRHSSGMWIHRGKESRQDCDVIAEVMYQDGYSTKTFPTFGGSKEVVVDVGAHIGSFAIMWKHRNPAARMVCVEANPDNWECLEANVAGWATVVRAACTYEKDFQFVNSICDNGTATGGSYIAPRGSPVADVYRLEERTIVGMTLEEIMAMAGLSGQVIHMLKLDCEGSEYSILKNTSLLPRIRFIAGEYHGGPELWDRERRRHLGPEWRYTLLRGGIHQGAFIYENTKCPSS